MIDVCTSIIFYWWQQQTALLGCCPDQFPIPETLKPSNRASSFNTRLWRLPAFGQRIF